MKLYKTLKAASVAGVVMLGIGQANATVIDFTNAGAVNSGVAIMNGGTWTGASGGALSYGTDYADFKLSSTTDQFQVNVVPNNLALPAGFSWELGTTLGGSDLQAPISSTAIFTLLPPVGGWTPGQEYFLGVSSTGGGSFTIAATQLNTVPLPAALPLFGAGLAGLGWVVRRRRSSSAVAA